MPTVQVVSSIRSLDPVAWDELAGDEVLATHGWLRTVEETYAADLEPRYYLVHREGRLLAAAGCNLAVATDRDFTLDTTVYGRFANVAAGLGLALLPAMLCGPISSCGTHLLVASDLRPREKAALFEMLLERLESAAFGRGLPLAFDRVFAEESDLISVLRRRRYNQTRHSPMCYLDVSWPTFDGYLGHLRGMSRNMARNARRDLKKMSRAGVSVERIRDTSRLEKELYDLAEAHWYRHNGASFPFKSDFFASLRENLGENAVVYGAFDGSSLIGFSLLLEKGGVAVGMYVGLHSVRAREAALYFNLCYYAPIQAAVGEAGRRIYFGRGLRETKIRKGCESKDLYLFLKSPSTLKHIAFGVLFFLRSARKRYETRAGT